jgi:hypothetical protein
MAETWAEEVARLQREIAERQARLAHLVLGDQRVGVGLPLAPLPFGGTRDDGTCQWLMIS